MREEKNNICFTYDNETYNVPMMNPWMTYLGEAKPAPFDGEQIDRSIGELFFVFHLTERCNMSCTYCFEGNKGYRDMSMDVVENFINFIKERNYKKFAIRFFGGEPTLRIDFLEEILLKFDEVFRKEDGYEIGYNIFTNGVSMPDKLIDLINKYDMGCLISLDGSREMHDRNRIFPNGKGSYDIVVENAKKLQRLTGKNIIFRAVYDTKCNDISLIDLVDACNKNGFRFLSIEIPWTESSSQLAMNDEKLEFLLSDIQEYAHECVRRMRNHDYSLLAFHEINRTLIKILFHRVSLSSHACSAGKMLVAVSTEGDLYPCHCFVNSREYKMGNFQEGITNMELKKKFESLDADTIQDCKECPIRYYCGNRCFADSFWYCNDIAKMNQYRCALEKEYFKAAIYIYNSVRDDLELILEMKKFALKQFDMKKNT